MASHRPYPDNEGLQVSNPQSPEVVHQNLPEVIPIHQEKQLSDGHVPGGAPNEKYLYEEPVQNGRAQTFCGLKKRTFWIALVLSVIVVVAVAVGAGVGATRRKSSTTSERVSATSTSFPTAGSATASPTSASSSSSSSSSAASSSTTITTTTSASQTPFPTSGILDLGCPGLDRTSYTTEPTSSNKEYTFTLACNSNFQGNDLLKSNATSVDECMDACAKHDYASSGTNPCQAIVFNANLTLALNVAGANCFFKTTSANIYISGNMNVSAAAILNSVVDV